MVVNKIFNNLFIFYKLKIFKLIFDSAGNRSRTTDPYIKQDRCGKKVQEQNNPKNTAYSVAAKLDAMPTIRPCPLCRKPTAWEGNAWKPFCSDRCRTLDLGAWSSEGYRVPAKPEAEDGESWSDPEGP